MKTILCLLSLCLFVGCAPSKNEEVPLVLQKNENVEWGLGGSIYITTPGMEDETASLGTQLQVQFENGESQINHVVFTAQPTLWMAIPKVLGSISIGCSGDSKTIPNNVIADTIIFCGELDVIQDKAYMFEANQILFKEAKIRFINSQVAQFGSIEFRTSEIIIQGDSEITSEGETKPKFRGYNSHITVDTSKVSGSGILKVISKASFRVRGV